MGSILKTGRLLALGEGAILVLSSSLQFFLAPIIWGGAAVRREMEKPHSATLTKFRISS